MRIGVPGEFHEDRWPRTAEDSERHVLPRTREAGMTHRIQVIAWQRRASGRSSARRPCPQVPQWHHRVAKRASIGTLARGPSTEALLWQGSVAKGRESVPLKGLRSSLRPGLARHPRLQIVLRQGRVAKRASIGTLALGFLPQVLQWHPRVAKKASIGTSARGLLPKVLQRHPSVAKRGFRPTLRHGDPQQNHLIDGSAWRRNLFSNKDY